MPAILFGTNSFTSSDNNGPVIHHPHVELVFWGNAWNNAATSPSVSDVTKAATSILTGPYLPTLGQYRTFNFQGLHLPNIGTGSVVGTKISKDKTPTNGKFAGGQGGTVETWLAQKINNGAVPSPTTDSNLLYIVVLPPGVSRSSAGNTGLHTFGTDAKGHKFHYAWIGNDGTLDFVSNVFSHELAEAVTDPEGTAIQVDPRNANNWNEISDGEAENYSYRLNGYLVQAFWSQRDNHFSVPTGQQQDFFVDSNGILTVNGDQLANKDDTITIDQRALRVIRNKHLVTYYTDVRVTLNGETVDFDPGVIKGIDVRSGGGNDTITVLHVAANCPVTIKSTGSATVNVGAGSVQGINSDVTIGTGQSFHPGAIAINVDDSADAMVRNVTYDAKVGFNSTFSSITGLAPAKIYYYTLSTTGVTVKGGVAGGTDTVYATYRPLILINQGYSPVLVGKAGSVQQIVGDLTVKHVADNLAGSSYIYVGDSADGNFQTVTHDTFSPDGATVFGRISGLSLGNILYQNNLHDATIALGSAGGRVNILATANTLVNVDSNGNSEINVGNNGTLDNIQSDVTVVIRSGAADLVIDDSADPVARNIDVASDGVAETVTGLTSGRITLIGNVGSNLAIRSGTGGNTFTVEGTLSGGTYLLGGSGDDTFNVQAITGGVAILGGGGNDTVNIGNAGSVQGILGPVFIANPDGQTAVTVDDSANPNAQNASLDQDAITGLAPGAIHFGGSAGTTLLTININDATTLTVNDTVEAVQTVINAGANATVNVSGTTGPLDIEGAGLVTLGNVGTLDGIAGQVTIGAQTLVGSVVVDDSGDATGRAVSITAVEIDGLAPAPIIYDIVANLTILGGQGDDTFSILQTPQFTQNTLNGGGGINTLDYSALAANVLVNLQTGTATGFAGGIANIQNVIGSSNGGAGTWNILVGNGGNFLTGGTGQRNLLIAGQTASTLIGGDDEDILIAGTTNYDQDNGALTQIMTEWARTDEDYDTRLANLSQGNGVPLLDATTAAGNLSGNTLTGNAGRDLFFARFGRFHRDTFTDLENNETLITI